MFGITARRERESRLQAEAERLIAAHGVGGALAKAVDLLYDDVDTPALPAHAQRAPGGDQAACGPGLAGHGDPLSGAEPRDQHHAEQRR